MKLKNTMQLGVMIFNLLSVSLVGAANIKPSDRYETKGSKTGLYIQSGYFTGGDKNVKTAEVIDVRRAWAKEGFERIVFEIKSHEKSPVALPYFQAQLQNKEHRLVLSLWGNVASALGTDRLVKIFKKSKFVKSAQMFNQLEDGLSIIELALQESASKSGLQFEAFFLQGPDRVVLDLKPLTGAR